MFLWQINEFGFEIMETRWTGVALLVTSLTTTNLRKAVLHRFPEVLLHPVQNIFAILWCECLRH